MTSKMIRATTAALGLAVCLAACTAWPARATTFPARVLRDSLGVNAQFLSNVTAVTTPEEREAAAEEMARQGIRVVRTLGSWRDIEPQPPSPITGHRYYWSGSDGSSGPDAYMVTLASHGIRSAPGLGGTPWWDSALGPADQFHNLGSHTWAPLHPDHFAAFAGAWAARYGPGGDFWDEHRELPELPPLTYEVWNEPNVNGSFTNPAGGSCPLHTVGVDQGPKQYAMLYMPARAAIHAVDHDAVVMVGGLSGHTTKVRDSKGNDKDICTVQEFLAGMKAHSSSVVVDAVGMHAYPQSATAGAADIEAAMVDIRQHIDDLGWTTDLDLYVNENGWRVVPSGNPTADEQADAQRGDWLAQLADRMLRSNCGIRQYVPHTWLAPETDPANGEHYFGIANFNGTVKTSGATYGAMVRRLQGEGTSAPNPAVEHLCPWRGEPDIDRDGFDDGADGYPADPTQH